MRLWADIYDADDNRLGVGPVWAVQSANVTRILDGAGSISITMPGTEERAIDLIQNERRARVYALMPAGVIGGAETTRLIGTGILREIALAGESSGWTLTANGPDLLDELKRENTLLARIYDNQTLAGVVSSLVGLAGWTATVDAAIADDLISMRYDGQSVLKALQNLCDLKGYHLRHAGNKLVQVAPLGDAAGLRLVGVGYAPVDIYSNEQVMLIESLTINRRSENLYNWLLPVGGGEGESALTLQYSTRTSPYTIQTTSVDGATMYYLSDAGSIGQYGTIKKVARFKQISPISNNDIDLEIAANALYDAAAVALTRSRQPQVTYSVRVKHGRQTILPGDRVRLTYRGFISNEAGEIVNYADVDDDFWVMRVKEHHGREGLTVSLDISNVDQVEQDTAQVLVGALEAIEIRELRVQPYPALANYVYRREIDSSHAAEVPIEITNNVLYLNQARVRIFTRPFRTTAKAAKSGGGTAGTSGITGGIVDVTVVGGSYSAYTDDANPTTPHRHWFSVPGHSHNFTMPNHSHSVNIPAHTHTLDYGIEDDSEYPDTVRLLVNGADVTAALGGPWGVGGGEINTMVDVTPYLVGAAGGLRQRHEITLSCGSGQGEVEVTVELRMTVQSIAAG